MKVEIKIILLLWLIITSPLIHAQDRPSYEADLRRGVKNENGSYQELEGSVILRQDNITIYCNNATYYPETNQSLLTGSVVLVQDSLTLYSERLTYDANTKISRSPGSVRIENKKTTLVADEGTYLGISKIADFINNVFIEDDSVKINAQRIIYEKISGNSYGYKEVEIKGKYSDTRLYCDSVEYYPDQFFTLATGDPLLVQIDTVSVNKENNDTILGSSKFIFDTLAVSSRLMEAYRIPLDEHYIFTDSVIMTKSELTLKCEKGIYFKDRDYFSFVGEPVIWYDENQLYGDSILVNVTKTRKLKNIQSYINALMVSEADSIYSFRKNQLSSDYIDMQFVESEIDLVLTYGNTKNLYFLMDEGIPDGALRILSDNLAIEFIDGEMTELDYSKDQPFNEGKQIPEKTLRSDNSLLTLPGFRWTEKKPKQKEIR
ncbi:MAG: hypothetical protein Kapaf2KO_06080 [Candidatus Kapaibacteriales bacterium]